MSKLRTAVRRPGYFRAVMKVARAVSDTHVQLTEKDFQRIRKAYALSPGPGSELKAILKAIGIASSPTCSCNKRVSLMDERGCDWCESHIDEIVGWLREEAAKRKFPIFCAAVGRLLVRIAIKRARKGARA